MASIASPLTQRKKEPDEEQLLKLFWNRAELKKELGKLRREKSKLLDQIRQQESLNLRIQQRMEQLENVLADPLLAANAVVYYQLRGVWQQARKRLARLARELSERQQEREEQNVRLRFDQKRNADLADIDEKLAENAARARRMESDLRALRERNRQLRGIWNYFRRRAIQDQAAAITAVLEGIKTQDERLRAARRERELEPYPPSGELSVEGKRNINLAIVALAQQLLVHFAEHNVAGLAREAAVRALTEVTYGTAAECQALSEQIGAVVRSLDADDKLNSQVRRRAEMLKHCAQYRRDTDTVPIAGSFASLPVLITETGEPRAADGRIIPVNILADEYWDIYNVLLN
jgi:hypothetical protein